ncbi:anoctamin-10 isoform X2 [Bombina bombina]|nr:anoctamin-10 isoform X2 [Bombina bombina]XP_053558957.1 anoctamin-10 isoform X2 [Bombina bombina]
MGSWTPVHCKCCVQPSVRTLAAMQLKEDIKPETKKWLISILEAPKKDGGAHVLVHPGEDDDGNFLLLSATSCSLLQAIEVVGLSKPDLHGSMRTFSYEYRKNFLNADKLDSFLTLSEQQFLLKHEIESVKVLQETCIPGYLEHKLFPGQQTVDLLQKWGIIVKFYPVHDKEELKSLIRSWYKQISIGPQPIDAVRAYFGESVALYFRFLEYFTVSLIAMVVLHFICMFFEDSFNKYVIFAVFNVIWSTVFLELWKRHSSVKAYFWGTLYLKSYFETSRPNFGGLMMTNPITGRYEPYYPQWKRKLWIIFVTVPVVCVFVGLAVDGMTMFLYWEHWCKTWYKRSTSSYSVLVLHLPSVCHTIYMEILNTLYRRSATTLTEWENHRTESSFQNHMTIKVLAFRFVNCFGLLFYITFCLQDLQLLKKRLSSLLIVSQAINQFSESLLPYLKQRLKLNSLSLSKTKSDAYPFIDYVVSQGDKFSYPGLFDDYMELFVQFGYVSLFSSVYPLTAVLLVLNNITEIRTDAFKLCQVFQKPFFRPAANIGIWQVAFEILGFFSVITNCFLAGMSPEIKTLCQTHVISPEKTMICILITEHFLIVLKLIVAFAIPDKPGWLQFKVMQMEYHSWTALKASSRFS